MTGGVGGAVRGGGESAAINRRLGEGEDRGEGDDGEATTNRRGWGWVTGVWEGGAGGEGEGGQ